MSKPDAAFWGVLSLENSLHLANSVRDHGFVLPLGRFGYP